MRKLKLFRKYIKFLVRCNSDGFVIVVVSVKYGIPYYSKFFDQKLYVSRFVYVHLKLAFLQSIPPTCCMFNLITPLVNLPVPNISTSSITECYCTNAPRFIHKPKNWHYSLQQRVARTLATSSKSMAYFRSFFIALPYDNGAVSFPWIRNTSQSAAGGFWRDSANRWH